MTIIIGYLLCLLGFHVNPEPENPRGVWHWYCGRCGLRFHHTVNTPGGKGVKNDNWR